MPDFFPLYRWYYDNFSLVSIDKLITKLRRPATTECIIFWNVVLSFYSYRAWKFNGAAESPFSILWITCTIIMVSSEAWSNRLLSIVKENNRRIDLICQFILFLLYALCMGISITMFILTHPKPVSLLSIYTTDHDNVQFSFSLALCLSLIISIIMNHLVYFDYAMREKKVIQDLRQRNFLVMASFSYTLRLLSIAFLIFTSSYTISHIMSRRLYWHFTVPVISFFYFMFDSHNTNYIDQQFCKETICRYVNIFCMTAITILMFLFIMVFRFSFPLKVSILVESFRTYFPFLCWIMFVSIARRNAIQKRIDAVYLQFKNQEMNLRIYKDSGWKCKT